MHVHLSHLIPLFLYPVSPYFSSFLSFLFSQFFAAIPEDKYIVLAELCKIQQFQPGEIVFRQGDPANCFYIIAHGEVKVTITQDAAAEGGQELTPVMSPSAEGRKASVTNTDARKSTVVNGEKELTRMGPGKYFGQSNIQQSLV